MTTNTLPAPLAITADDTLNAIIARYPHTLPVFQRLGLDSCCGGALALHTAAQHHQLDLADVLAALNAAPAGNTR